MVVATIKRDCRTDWVVLAAVTLAVILCFNVASANLSDFLLVAENEHLQLYINESTTEIAVLMKESGDVWCSNPQNRETMETIARGRAKEQLSSQFIIEYFKGNQSLTMDNYTESVSYGQYNIVPIENGVRVEYVIGKEWDDDDYLPLVMSKERFDQLLASFEDEKDRQFIREQYVLFTLERGYEDPDGISIHGVDLDLLFGEYGVKVEEPSFRPSDKRRLVQEYLNAVRTYKGYPSIGSIRTEDIQALFDTPTYMRKWNIKVWDKDELIELMKSSNYTPDMIALDHLQYNVSPPSRNLLIFNVAIEYVIDGSELVVRVPCDEIVYPKDVVDPKTNKLVTYPLTSISVLPYFGAADIEEDGYMFVPDGSGALIYLNNGKTKVQPYRAEVYGRDYAIAPIREYSDTLESQIYLPVFGMKHQDKAFVAIIESGDALARIYAEVAGMRDSYNKVWSNFLVIPNARVNMQSAGALIYMRDLSINMYQSRPYQGDIIVRYAFLDEAEASYAGMALRYQEYLVDRYGLSRLDRVESIPLLLELIGGIEKTEPVFGISRNVIKPLTTFEQVKLVVNEFINQGIDQLKVRYSGWLKGGIEHIYPSSARLENKLGSKSQFSDLVATLEAAGVELYPNVSFLTVYKSSIFDDFITFRDASRLLNRRSAYLNRYNLSTHLAISSRQVPLLSPARLPRLVAGFLSDYEEFGVSGLSLDSLGQLLYADYRTDPDELVDREQAKSVVIGELSKFGDRQLSLMIAGANAYAIPYADFVVEAPQYSRGYEILDQGVPFYQIVLRGYVNYAGEPGNLSQRLETYKLKLLETGAVPYYLLCYVDAVEVKNSNFDYLYSISYANHVDDIVSLYNEISEVLQPVWHSRIVDHKTLAVNVYQTTYEGGTSIIVNYNSDSVNVLGVDIPGYGYLVLSGGNQDGQAEN